MNVKSKALRVLGVIGGVLLSILLVVMLIAAPLYSVTASIITPQTVTKVVQNIDYAAMLGESDALEDLEGTEHLPSEMMGAMMESPFVEDVLSTYTETMVAVLRGGEPTDVLSKEKLLAMADEHMDDLLQLVNTYMPDADTLTEAEMREHIHEAVDSMGEELLQTLPTGAELQEMVLEDSTVGALTVLVNTSVPLMLYGIIAVLAALIFVCLLHRFRGLLCLGIDALVALIPLLSVYLLLREGGLLYNQIVNASNPTVMASVLDVLSQNMLVAVIVMAVVGLALIAGYTMYVSHLKKQAAAPVEAPVEAPTLPQE